MGTKNKAWHSAVDTPEQIQMCLSCKRPRCVNCIGEGRTYRSRRQVEEYKTEDGVRINRTDRAVLMLYPTSKSDKDIADKLGKPRATISSVRRKLKLPSILGTTVEYRSNIVEMLLKEGA